MVVARVLLVFVAPLRLTLWVLLGTATLIVALLAFVVASHIDRIRGDRRRERVRVELEPVFARFREHRDPGRLGTELRPAILKMDAAHRPVAAVLVIDLMHEASSPAQAAELRRMLEESGITELAEKGTRRRSPWRRALACELLGKVGTERAVPVLVARLDDRRPEVRSAAVGALGEIGSAEAVPALSQVFLARTGVPINLVNNALRRIGPASAPTFERGVASADAIVRVSSCFGLAQIAEERDTAAPRLAAVLETDPDVRVRTAAAKALGFVGGNDAPAALLSATADPEVHPRRAAVRALGAFDDPTTFDTLEACMDDDDRETAIRAAESLLALTERPRAASGARERIKASSAWALQYVRVVAEVSA
jgi:HEAT repeat protein